MGSNGVLGRPACIVGIGAAMAPTVITNADLEKIVETSDEWIVSRTGIKQRRVVRPDQATSDIATEAAQHALANAGLTAQDLDLIIVATATPDMLFPSTACFVQHKLGIKHTAAFDISAACCGFLYGLSICNQFIKTGESRTALLVGAETLSKIVDWKDRGTCVLFGDGAGAAILQASMEEGQGVLGSQMWADGNLAPLLDMPAGGSRRPTTHESIDEGLHHLKMVGSEVFKHAVRVMTEGVQNSLKQSGMTVSDVDLFVPHQANLRIIQGVADRLDMPMEKVMVNIDQHGNTSAASIGIALEEAVRTGRLRRGHVVAMAAFGAGLTMSSCVMRW